RAAAAPLADGGRGAAGAAGGAGHHHPGDGPGSAGCGRANRAERTQAVHLHSGIPDAAARGWLRVRGGVAPLARRPTAPLDFAAAADRGAEAEREAAADSAVGRGDASVLGVEPSAAAQAPGGDL